MRLAYFIMLHNNPQQFAWLWSALHNPDDLFLIHIDSKTPIGTEQAFRAIAGGPANLIWLEPRARIAWGGWRQAEVELQAIRHLCRPGCGWDFFINLSGVDYPLVDRTHLVAALSKDRGANYVACEAIDTIPPAIQKRARYLHLTVLDRVLRTPMPLPRPRSFRIEWKGSNWHILTRAFCEWISRNPMVDKVARHARWFANPDEFLIQALIGTSPFRDTRTSYRRQVFWPGPQTITLSHKDELLRSDAFFARKFDWRVDVDILRFLADRIGAKRPADPTDGA